MARVLVVGRATLDFVFAVDSLPQEATKYRAGAAEIVGGGPAANAACTIARLGGQPVLAARIGDDSIGDLIRSDLEAAGVSTEMVRPSPGGQSSYSSVYVDAAGERQIVNFPGCGLSEDITWLEAAPRTDAVLVDSRWPEGAAVALRLARDWGVPGVLDGEAPIPAALIEGASHAALSRQGLHSLVGTEDPAKAIAEVAANGPGWFCVTDGENGVFTVSPDGPAHFPAFQVPVADTLAAGDTWHGAFALALAEGRAEADATVFANATAALKCMRFGGRAGVPDRAAVTQFLKERT